MTTNAVAENGSGYQGLSSEARIIDLSDGLIMRSALSSTPVMRIFEDGSVSITHNPDDFYLKNDAWPVSFFLDLEQFADQKSHKGFYKRTGNRTLVDHKLHFDFKEPRLNLEAKFVFHQMLFNGAWALSTAFLGVYSGLARLAEYANQHTPEIRTFNEMQSDEFKASYFAWLEKRGLQTKTNGPREHSSRDGRARQVRAGSASIPSFMHRRLHECLDRRRSAVSPDTLWLSDSWEIKSMEVFGFSAVKTQGRQTICFDGFNSEQFKNLTKRYLKEKLLMRSIVWSTAKTRSAVLRGFFNFIHDRHPDWTDICQLDREDVLAYLEFLNIHAASIGSEKYASNNLSAIRTCISDMQDFEYPESPIEDIFRLIKRDYTRSAGRVIDEQSVEHIPDSVVDQLFDNFDGLTERWQHIVLTMYYTGQRVSDVLEMNQDCLVLIDGAPYVQLDVRKTKTANHRVPIPDDFAEILGEAIRGSKAISNDSNNPEKFLFVHYRGPNKGRPYSLNSVAQALNVLANARGIVDENGQIYHFKNHSFRHTYAMGMLNGGASILTVQELLAHRSPEMTMVYARLFDKTKYKEFKKAVKNGAFRFSDANGTDVVYEADVPEDVLRTLWLNHKLNAIDTPYGTCLQRKNSNCQFAAHPPCLTCDNGKPCKDLCIGAFSGDSEKYDVLIRSTKGLLNVATVHGRKDMAEENESLLTLLRSIRSTVDEGGVIYGRIDRLRRSE